jgi:hypothetical protein
MEGSCSTGQSPEWAVVPVEEEEELMLYSEIMFVFKTINIRAFCGQNVECFGVQPGGTCSNR